jgi:hypothetical protein
MHVATQIRFSGSIDDTLDSKESEEKSAGAFASLVGQVMGGLSSIFADGSSEGSEDDEV